ncbi:MAG: type III-B CRISPR-associated protein Cas10/Cmr2 [Bacteroidetes bacterium]|nr:type III-B CRISPR-associated protein Cas10/Cmr2 [Bacteroidota bacterium]
MKGLNPYHEEIKHSKYGAGMYPDRICFTENQKKKADLVDAIYGIISDISEDIIKHTQHKNKENVSEFLTNYLNLHIVEISTQAVEKMNIGDTLLERLYNLLDNKELRSNYCFNINENPLVSYFELASSNRTLLVEDAFEGVKNQEFHYIRNRGFRSIPEISSTSLLRIDPNTYIDIVENNIVNYQDKKKEEDEILDQLKVSNVFASHFRPYHKYFGVLYADGDNIGDLLKSLASDITNSSLQEFSRLLIEFAQKAEEVIYSYGGNGIYLGGEDILAFIPLACKNVNSDELMNVFNLIHQLDEVFAQIIGKYAITKGINPPTLSYGLMISYAKHPLRESMVIAHKLLEKAKNKKDHSEKNTIGLHFQKHSGHVMKCFIEKNNEHQHSWAEIREIVKNFTKTILSEKQTSLLSGIIHRFNDEVFYTVYKEATKEKRLNEFFENFFNEEIHLETGKSTFQDSIKRFTEVIFEDYGIDNPASREIIYTVLRLIHFINSEKE